MATRANLHKMSFRAHFALERDFIWGSCCIVQDLHFTKYVNLL